jgi:hypothetical protein
LFESRAAYDLPDLLQIFRELHFSAVRSLDPTVAAEYLQCRPDAGKNQIRAADVFALKTFHPLADTLGKLAEDFAPVAYRRVVGTGTTDEMNAGGEGSGILRT